MGKMVQWRCRDCKSLVENPMVCIGNHECVKCSVCRGRDIELVRDTSEQG